MSNKTKIPIWLTNWVFVDKRGRKYTINDIFAKGETEQEIMNNEMLKTKVTSKFTKSYKRLKLSLHKVILVSQHGYGPRYEDAKIFNNGEKYN